MHGYSSLGSHLGSGQFGTVYKGVWVSPNGEVEVAVKTLNEGSGEEDRVKFLQEAAIMGQFKHPNVVEMYGVVTQGEPVSFSIQSRGGSRNQKRGVLPPKTTPLMTHLRDGARILGSSLGNLT